MPASLPLGLAVDAEYEEVSAYLQEGENVMLITDGVLEAQSNKGELYGFERVSDLMRARPSAQQVAQAACSFGQEDDITVVSVTWSRKKSA
jgi:serine phosphatase RsbU (regulator of sigma subunit)